MKWIKNILWLLLGLTITLILILHSMSYYMSYDTSDILKELPNSVVENKLYNNTAVRTVYVNNHSDTLIVFVHGAPGSFDAFLPYIKDSTFQQYNLLAYDRPGYGQSSLSPMPSIINQSKILFNIINGHTTDHTILIGHSYGGPIVGYTAAVQPELIDKAIMIAPLLDPDNEPIFWFSYFAKWPLTRWMLTNDLRTSGTEKFQHAQSLKEIEPFWNKLQKSILHMHGSEDGIAPPLFNTDYSRRMIDSNYLDLRIYPDEGHMILWDEFEMTKNAIVDFLK